MKTFEELHCWQKAKDLATSLYAHFKDVNDVLKEMVCKASIHIMTNIAVWHGQHTKYNLVYLWDAKWASAQLRSMLHIAKDLDYIDAKRFDIFYNEALDIAKMISGLMKAMKTDKTKETTEKK